MAGVGLEGIRICLTAEEGAIIPRLSSSRFSSSEEEKMSRRLSWVAVAVLIVALVAAGCGKKETAEPTQAPDGEATGAATAETPSGGPIKVKIGAVLPLTGAYATYGSEAKNGITIALEEAKREGKVDPELLIVDNGGTQQQTITAVKQFIDADKVDVIIGAILSNNSIAASDLADAEGVPMVSPASTNVEVTLGKKYMFRVCFTDEVQGPAAADFAYDTLGARRAAVLVSSSDSYSMGLGKTFTEAFKRRGGEIVTTRSFNADTDDFGGQITQLRLTSPEVIFLPAYYEAVAKCISQARMAGLRSTFVGTDGWDSLKLYTLSKGAVKGNYFTTHFSPEEDRDLVKKFVQNYRAAYEEPPGAIAALSYDAAVVVFDAVTRAGSSQRQAIADALGATKAFEGVTGTFSIDENHDAVKSLVIMETTESGAKLKQVINP